MERFKGERIEVYKQLSRDVSQISELVRLSHDPGLRIVSGDSGLCQDGQWSLGKLSIVKTELFILKQSHDSYLTFSSRYRAMIPSLSSLRSLNTSF